MTFPPTDFHDRSYLRALTHGLCAACLAAAPAYMLSREGRAGDHLPNLSVCRDCRWEAVAACRRRREAVAVFLIGDILPLAPDATSPPPAFRQASLFDAGVPVTGEEANGV